MQPKYPEIHVQLTGKNGNAFFILGRVTKAMLRAGLTNVEIREFREEATSGDYDHLLQTVMKYVDAF